jgi:ABC-type transport system involved in multi-copper enzyme maturation permease subunit
MSVKNPSWQEATAGGLWLLGAAGLTWLGPQLPLLERVILWVILSVGLLIILRRFWAWLLGPLFFYDLVRTVRRNRLIPVRCLFAIALLAVVFLFYLNWFGLRGDSWGELFLAPSVRREDLASFGSSMFSLFFGMQYLAVFLLTPIYTAGAVAEEKERRTLDLLLTTELTNREIVLGLLASRLATLGLIFLTILPVLSLMEFLGGIDPKAVVIGFAFTGIAAMNLGSLCILVSLYSKTSTQSILQSYVCHFVLGAFWGWLPFLFFYHYDTDVIIRSAVFFVLVSGAMSSIFIALAVVRFRQTHSGMEAFVHPPAELDFSEMPYWTALGFREVFPDDDLTSGSYRRRRCPVPARASVGRPVTDMPILWKEFTFQSMPAPLAVYLFFCFVFFLCSGMGLSARSRWEANSVLRDAVPLGVALLVLPVGFLSSRKITKEREGGTLDGLLTTCLETKEILRDKWLASILRMRWPFACLVGGLALAVLGEAIHPAAFMGLVGATVVYIGFFASLGLLISTRCSTTLKAMLIFIIVFLLFGLADALPLGPMSQSPEQFPWAILRLIYYAVSPLSTLRELTFDEQRGTKNPGDIVASFGAVIVVALATWFLWKWTVFSFERSTGSRPPKRRLPVPVNR